MICGHCGHENVEVDAEVCPQCGVSPILDERYRLDEIVGRGAAGITYRATAIHERRTVAVKELPFRQIDDLKVKELFEREANVLEQLDHPGVPAYVDDFTYGTGKNVSLFLVQEFIDGPNLDAELQSRRYDEMEVLAVMREVATILAYLHGLSPPVVHRDVKPKNVLRRPNGALALVDFGSVRAAIEDRALGGSTVAGTFGYMAPEQFRGDATAKSDLYAVGALGVRLLTRKDPSVLVDHGGRLTQWRPLANVGNATANLIDTLLDADPDNRPESARDLIQRIQRVEMGMDDEEDEVVPTAPPEREAIDVAPTKPPPVERLPVPVVDDLDTQPPKRGGGMAALLGVAAVVAGLFVFMTLAGSRSDDVPATATVEVTGPAVPTGLKGLSFGMTRGSVEQKLPEVSGAEMIATEEVRIRGCPPGEQPMLAMFGGESRAVPGEARRVSTKLGSFPAKCDLFFTEGTLAKMKCLLSFDSAAAHAAGEQALLASLTKRYGSPHSSNGPTEEKMLGLKRTGTWTWSDPNATLELRSRFEETKLPGLGDEFKNTKSSIEVVNVDRAYEQFVQAFSDKEDDALCAKHKTDAAKRAAEEQKAVQEIQQQSGKKLEEDL